VTICPRAETVFDLTPHSAPQLPVRIIARLLGVPEEMMADLSCRCPTHPYGCGLSDWPHPADEEAANTRRRPIHRLSAAHYVDEVAKDRVTDLDHPA